MNDNLLAVIDHVYEDGVSLIFAGSSEPSLKHYLTNSAITFQAGQRVKCCKISGTLLVEYPIGSGSSPHSFDITEQNVNQYFDCTWNMVSPGWKITNKIISPNNIGVHSTYAQAIITSKQSISVTISVDYNTEYNYDKVKLSKNNEDIAELSGNGSQTYGPYNIHEDDYLIFTYSKDSSTSVDNEYVKIGILAELI